MRGFVIVSRLLLMLMLVVQGGCGQNVASKSGNRPPQITPAVHVLPAAGAQGSIALSAAKNEWISFSLQISGVKLQQNRGSVLLQVGALSSGHESIPASQFSAFQLLSMPVDLNRAGFVRQTGLPVTNRSTLGRALLPMKIDSGAIDLSAARDPAQPTNSAQHASGDEPIVIWIDLHVPPDAAAGQYGGACELLSRAGGKPIASIPISLNVDDFILPDERHLSMVGRIDWDELRRLYPDFETVEPQRISRGDHTYDAAVRTLDRLVALAQLNRAQVVFPRLQPTVKWPRGAAVQEDWSEFDSIVAPWLNGDAFADKVPLNYWQLPAIDYLFNYNWQSQAQYWSQAAAHFEQAGWLGRAVVSIEKTRNGRPKSADSIALSADAARILAVHPKLRVSLPLEATQLQISSGDARDSIDPQSAGRLIVETPGLVSNSPLRLWPADIPMPASWLRTDLPGLIPFTSLGGDEFDVRLWAWLAFLRDARLIQWASPLPAQTNPLQSADPGEIVWFYPGSWFGVDEPVPTVQLKWLRRAEQDYEYLWLARQRGQNHNALAMARLLTKPVEIQPNQPEDPTYALMCGTTDPLAWSEVRDLLAKNILLHDSGDAPDRDRNAQLDVAMLHWSAPQQRPILMARTTQWFADGGAGMLGILGVRLGIDIYNASDTTHPADNFLQWTAPYPLQVRPQPYAIQPLAPYRVQRLNLDAQIDPQRISNADHPPLVLTFINGYDQRATNLKMMLPIALCDRHPPGLKLDGSLEDWSADDAIQNGPLVQYFNRPAVQSHELQLASTPSSIYSGWSDDHFYVAFKLAGLSQQDLRAAQNFVSYEFRRTWGEDLCEMLIQPVYRDSVTGPVLHVVCKPNGSVWIERKGDARTSADPWPPFEGAGVRFKGTIDGPTWRGEIAIPWKAIDENFDDPHRGRPIMLRFNFTQHKTDTGESSSWAGPIDSGRDDAFMGLLYIRDTNIPGMAQQGR